VSAHVLVLGGQGVFGARIVRQLARDPGIAVTVASRGATAHFDAGWYSRRRVAVDVSAPGGIDRLLERAPAVVVDAVGPFQSRDLALPTRCAEAGIHYVDIADDRARVAGIGQLDALARSKDVLIVSGASTVPAISTAMVEALVPPTAASMGEIVSIDVGISPGNRAPRGLATVRGILSYCGRQIPAITGEATEYGWGGLTRFDYPPPVGARWMSHVDTPERALWASRFPALERASIRAGLELGLLHLGLSMLSRGVRAGVLPGLDRFAAPMLWVADRLESFGTDTGAMHVRVERRGSTDARDARILHTGLLIAERADGPQIPATPAVVVVKKLLGLGGHAPLTLRGAMPCIGMLTLDELLQELRGYAIRYEGGR
jgi:hypothetical protein